MSKTRLIRRLAWLPVLIGIGALTALCARPTAALTLRGAGVAIARSGTPGRTGGAPISAGGLAPTSTRHAKVPPPPSRNARGRWLSGVTITEYWPAPESSFAGELVRAPGLPGLHRIDWLYSATGVSMEGEGIGLDGRMYHINALGDGGWVTASGRATSPSDGWAGGPPFWRAGAYWRNDDGAVTFPLSAGGWSAGRGLDYVPLRNVSFAAGASLPLRYYQSIAIDPRLIGLGSRVYVPAYRGDGHGGWFVAQDTGGAIKGRHIDVFRPPPTVSGGPGQELTGKRIYVIRPGR